MKIFKWFVILLLAITLLAGFLMFNNWRHLQSEYEQSEGVYIVNLNKSNIELLRQDSIQLIGLKLKLNADGSFDFSHRVSYFAGTFGVWEVDGYGMDNYIMIKMSGGRVYQFDTCCARDSTISVAYPYSDQSNKYGSLAFEKLATKKEKIK